MALALTSGIGPPPLPLTPLVIVTVLGSLPARTQASLIRYRVQGLLMASTTQLLPLTISISLSQVTGSVRVVTDTVGLRALIASRVDLVLLVNFLPSVCINFRWRLDTSTTLWSTTVMRPTPLADKNRRRVDPMPPTPTTRTDDERSLHWPNTPNLSQKRIWREYRKIWSLRSHYLLRNPQSRPPLLKSNLKTDQLVLLPPQLLRPVDDNFTSRINYRPIFVTPLVLFALAPDPSHLLLHILHSPLTTTLLLFERKI